MNPWITTADALPKQGDFVQFVVEQSNVVLRGTYEQCTFKSRWSHYSPTEVSEWRKLGESPASWALALKIKLDSTPAAPLDPGTAP